jgi:hypothetical protein
MSDKGLFWITGTRLMSMIWLKTGNIQLGRSIWITGLCHILDCAFRFTSGMIVSGKDKAPKFNGGQVVLGKQYSELFILNLLTKQIISRSVNYGSIQWVRSRSQANNAWIWNGYGTYWGKTASQDSQDELQNRLNITLNNIFELAGAFSWMSAH